MHEQNDRVLPELLQVPAVRVDAGFVAVFREVAGNNIDCAVGAAYGAMRPGHQCVEKRKT